MINESDPKKRGRASKRKGADAERELAKLFRDMYGYPVRRGRVFDHESDMVGLDGIHPEVKAVERLNVYEAMAQAITEAKIRKDGIPVVFHKRTRSGWHVTMRLEDWADLYGAWRD